MVTSQPHPLLVLPFWYTDCKGTRNSLACLVPRIHPSSSLGCPPSNLHLSTKGTPPLSSENPQAASSSASSTEDSLDTKKCPLSQVSHCLALLHHQQINAGTRNDLPIVTHRIVWRL